MSYPTLLASVTQQFSKVAIVVDALDEFADLVNNLPNRKELVECLTSLTRTKLLFTSRKIPAIESLLADYVPLQIRPNENDTESYVNFRIEKSELLLSHIKSRPSLKDDIMSCVKKSYSNMYFNLMVSLGIY